MKTLAVISGATYTDTLWTSDQHAKAALNSTF
jgi:hypothetical protein